MENSYLILTLLWFLYFTLHSVGAANQVKGFSYQSLGLSPKSYRLIYVVFSTIGLLGILFYSATIIEDPLIENSKVLKFIGLALATWGIIIIKQSFKQYKLNEFIGLSRENPGDSLEVKGILAKVRHPLYSATILIVVGFVFFIPKLTSVIMMGSTLVYILVGIYLEEKKLIKAFGKKYVSYKQKVPMLIPRMK